MSSNKAVILFNLGGPETLADVRPFLYNLFADPDIIRIKNNILRKSLAWFIATTRQRKSRNLYRQIGGGSPLRRITQGQADALAARLEARGIPCRVYVAMRCWKPTIDDAVEQLKRDNITRAVALPLFPQFSFTTTGSCFNYFRRVLEKEALAWKIEVSYVDAWYDEPRYIQAMAGLVRDAMSRFSAKDPAWIHLLYSAHSIPARYVEEESDPYLTQTQKTVEKINESLGHVSPSTLAFQSKVGPVKWLGPSTDEILREMGRKGIRNVLAIPISFVSDHIETLQEIDILYRRLAAKSGIAEFQRAASLNLDPTFIEALADIAQRALGHR
jgi:ferrochelatase